MVMSFGCDDVMRSCWDLDWLFKASQITKRSDVNLIKFS